MRPQEVAFIRFGRNIAPLDVVSYISRVIFRRIEGVEAVVFRFDLRPIRDDETDLSHDPANLIAHLADQMVAAWAHVRPRQGYIHRRTDLTGKRLLLQLCYGFLE